MGKRDDYFVRVATMLASGMPIGEIEAWLVANSNLPGRRGNLELAWAFGDAFAQSKAGDARWREVQAWLCISEADAPTGDPREFLPFCALQAGGSTYGLADAETRQRIIAALKTSASDGRWRIREAVAMGFQRIAESDFEAVASILEAWVGEASLLEKRAIVATLAHPDLLAERARVARCLAVVEIILREMLPLDPSARRTEGFRVLKKGLQFAISVFAAASPDEGFPFIARWAAVGDPTVRAILRANLQKARLAKRYPDRVAGAVRLLEAPEL